MGNCPHCGAEIEPGDLTAEDNSFRADSEPNQTHLDELSGVNEPEGSDGDSVWDMVDDDIDPSDIEVTSSNLEPGDVFNEHDPAEW